MSERGREFKEQMRGLRGGGPAFPTPPRGPTFQHPGMSLWDYFAATALCGILARFDEERTPADIEGFVGAAYVYADAMLAEREKS